MRLALALLLTAAPLSAQVVDTMTTTTTTVIPRMVPATPSVIVQAPPTLDVDSLATILAGMDRDLVVVALDGCDCGGSNPWWWRAGLLGLGVGALYVVSKLEFVDQTTVNVENNVTTTVKVREVRRKKKGKHP